MDDDMLSLEGCIACCRIKTNGQINRKICSIGLHEQFGR